MYKQALELVPHLVGVTRIFALTALEPPRSSALSFMLP